MVGGPGMFVKEIRGADLLGQMYDWSLQKQNLGRLPSLDKITVGSCFTSELQAATFQGLCWEEGSASLSLSLVAAVFPLQKLLNILLHLFKECPD